VPLPAGQLSRGSFDFRGTVIHIRSLTRKEAHHVKALGDDSEAAEAYILECGTDTPAEEVDAFLGAEGASDQINKLLYAIARLSGIKIQITEEEEDPKAV
jgi:hypothetical protein